MTTASPDAAARNAFNRTFGGEPTHLGRAPGRVELLGNHTDYNGGLVMAAAIDRETAVVGRAVEGRAATVHSADLGETDRFDLDAIVPAGAGSWSNYVRGVVWSLQRDLGRAGSGFELAISGNVPLGAGLSSSASLQAALAAFLLGAGVVGSDGLPADDAGRLALAHRLRRSENEFVGVASGLLDQFSVLFGRENQALSLDCRSLGFERVSIGEPAPAIVVCDSRTSRRLADGMYNRRRAECEGVVDRVRLDRGGSGVESLRDVTFADLERLAPELDPAGLRRARHVLSENARVAEGVEALRSGDLARFGRLISASHVSSRDDFENSSPALDVLIASAEESPGYLGGKLSGAGWAGCTVNLVAAEQSEAFAESVRERFARRVGDEPIVHVCRAAEGASARRL